MLSHPQVPLTTIVAQQRWSDVYLYTASTFSRCRRLEHFLSRVYPSVRCQCVLPALQLHVNVRDFFAFQWKETHLMSQNTLMLELRKCLRSFELSKGVWIYFELDLKCWSVFGLGLIIYLIRIDPRYVNYRRVAKSNLNSTDAYFATKNEHQKMAQKLPKITQNSPKMTQNCPNWPKNDPKLPKWPKNDPKRPKN